MTRNKIAYVYIITNTVNDKHYIGIARNERVFNRWNEHVANNSKLGEAMRTYGLENFKFGILAKCEDITDQELFALESKLIRQYNSINNGYNVIYSKAKKKQKPITNETAINSLSKFKDIVYLGNIETHKKMSFWKMLTNKDTCFPLLLASNNYLTRKSSIYYKQLHAIFMGRKQKHFKVTYLGTEYVTSNILNIIELFEEANIECYEDYLVLSISRDVIYRIELSYVMLFDDEIMYYEKIEDIDELLQEYKENNNG